jgi:hypothetical protein
VGEFRSRHARRCSDDIGKLDVCFFGEPSIEEEHGVEVNRGFRVVRELGMFNVGKKEALVHTCFALGEQLRCHDGQLPVRRGVQTRGVCM